MGFEARSNNYRKAIVLVAINENPKDVNIEQVSEYMSVVLISKLFNVALELVAEEIVKIRSYLLMTKKIS